MSEVCGRRTYDATRYGSPWVSCKRVAQDNPKGWCRKCWAEATELMFSHTIAYDSGRNPLTFADFAAAIGVEVPDDE